jgi:uncharacterized protein YbaP (TraB family)
METLPSDEKTSLSRAMMIVSYWNQNHFEGRFKTEQTLRAEMILKEAGFDPSEIGISQPARRASDK